ncbi:hypothetical protein [Photorhabdus luminescens]|uniref:Uncharacterized protein n=1 Tax=Photorhabdus luminescens subsp. mexicana TaxID=2100167 RepID=A0A4R4JJN1_PHOLU|nr:hypothetical protein [Photorhabdus luminescens]TDB54022.1 hypothetical protein C5468_05705 [Photorhabdus luminescens subsp. mexicana]
MGTRFEIEAHLDWCKIFDGEMRSPMQCQLALFNSYSLIYIDMTAKQAGADNLNIFKLLNHAFHLNLPEKEAPLLIQDAGFFTFSNHANPPEAEKLCNIFPQIPLPKSVTEMETPVSHSCTFWLTLRLKGNYLFNNLIEVGVKNGDLPQADISLSGRLDRGISAGESIKKSRYTAVLPDFKLFKIFGFNNLILKYQFDNYAKYEIAGTITLDLFQKTYCFDGALSADEKQVQASLKICHKGSESTIEQPFDGRMTGVTFDDLSFGIDYTFAVPEKKQPKVGLYWVKGTINYAKLPALSGYLYFLDNTPILASVAINKDLSIHDIFEASFANPLFFWPSNFIDIVFHPGSNLYYRRETDGDIKQENTIISSLSEKSLLLNQDITHYQPGFHLYALFDITLIETLTLKGDIQITKEGVNAEIQLLNPISLFVLQITGFGQDPGPTLFFSTVKENKFGLRCGLLFFKHDFGLNVEISGIKEKTGELKISGSLSSDKISSPLLPSSAKLGFSYSKSAGFKITDWPAFNLDNNQFINFIEELKKFSSSKGSNCGQLTHFVNEHLLTSRFSISPSFDTKTDNSSQNDQLYFVLNGKYTMTMAGTDFVTLSFPKTVEFLLPNNLSLEELPNAIGAALKSAAESFIQGLLENREAIAAFLTLTAAEKAADYAMTLLCEGLVDAALTEAIQTGAEALAAAGGVAAGAAGAAVIGNIINKIKDEIDSKPKPPDPPKPADPKPPENLSATYEDHKAKFAWGHTKNADGYQVKLKAPNNETLFNKKLNHKDNSVILPISPELAAGVYTWSIAATRQDFTSSENQLQQHRLPIPELNINLDTNPIIERDINLILKWNLVTDASHYNVQIEENGQIENRLIAAPQNSVTIIFDKLKPTGKYRFSLAALNNPNYIASEFCQVQQWSRLDTPQQIQANYQSGGIEIQWQCCPDITHYLLSLLDPNSEWIQQTVNSTTGRAHIALPSIPIAGTYQLYLASMPDTTATSIPSIWSDGVAIEVVITPEQIAQSAYQQQMSGHDCGKLIIESLPDLKANILAAAMAQVGYIAVETGQGLKSAYPAISASEITEILLAIYGKALTLEQLAQKAYDEHISGSQCGQILIAKYPATHAKALGSAMALAGYPATETGQGLKSAYPAISASEITEILLAIYGKALTLEQLAQKAYDEHISGSQCGQTLITEYPATQAKTLGRTMALAGYPATETGQGLKSAYPAISASEITAVLLEIYGRR